MQIVIDIPECFYEYCKAQEDAIEIQLAVANGTPLPKGHGRLIDADALIFNADYYEPLISKLDFDQAPTIIEAESEDKE